MQVRRDEGVAIRIGPEPCVGTREGVGEASVGECIGQPLSHERDFVPDADAVSLAEGETDGRVFASACFDPAWSETLACAEAPCAGTGRSPDWPYAPGVRGMVRNGKARSRSR